MHLHDVSEENEDEQDEELQRAFRMSLDPTSAQEDLRSAGIETSTVATSSSVPGFMGMASKRGREEIADSSGGDTRVAGMGGTERDGAPLISESAEQRERRIQRELRAAAAERRRAAIGPGQNAPSGPIPSKPTSAGLQVSGSIGQSVRAVQRSDDGPERSAAAVGYEEATLTTEPSLPQLSAVTVSQTEGAGEVKPAGENLQLDPEKGAASDMAVHDWPRNVPADVAEQLLSVVFGSSPARATLQQWSHQGFCFSNDSETSYGLVQNEGGPCGVLAPVQALILKFLLFARDDMEGHLRHRFQRRDSKPQEAKLVSAVDISKEGSLNFVEDERRRALVMALSEILWAAGGAKSAAVIAMPAFFSSRREPDANAPPTLDDVLSSAPAELASQLSLRRCSDVSSLLAAVTFALPSFSSPLGAVLFLFSALLSRNLENVQGDRDDPDPPLVTHPFGHASQEIVNLLLCGRAVANVFDGSMDLGGGMNLRGIPSDVEVGFLTLLEALHYCKVGQFLKNPRWPIWVVGSETHYTVIFGSDASMQDEEDSEAQESRIRRVFDEFDESGGGGFISPEGLDNVLSKLGTYMPDDLKGNLKYQGVVLWNEFWQALSKVDKRQGGLKDDGAQVSLPRQERRFALVHFNGIAKVSGPNGGRTEGDVLSQASRPRQTVLQVVVPPKWTPESMNMDIEESNKRDVMLIDEQEFKQKSAMKAPLVDCIRTRWQRATCSWVGDAPSIV